MTIAAAYLTSDGVVFGSDSTTTVGNGIQLLNHAQKVFEIGRPGRLGLCTWGRGRVGDLSHRTVAARVGDFVAAKNPPIREVADELVRIVLEATAAVPAKAGDILGYFVGGRDPVTREPGCVRVVIDGMTATVDPLTRGQCLFSGQPQIFTRVFWGADPELLPLLFQGIVRRCKNVPPEVVAALHESFAEVQQRLSIPGFSDLPIREAIDFVHTYLHVTIKAFKFRAGVPPVCGGPIEIGFVTTDREFRWAVHKDFYTAVYEQERHE